MPPPLILDFDGSVGPLDGAGTVPLRQWEESIRFACSLPQLRSLGRVLEQDLSGGQPVFIGSGDFHHVTLLLVESMRGAHEDLQVVVFDNHPDNMRLPIGIHCGSWVAHVSTLPFVSHVHVVGITSRDLEGLHVLENRLGPLRRRKVTYWSIGRDVRALNRLAPGAAHSFASAESMIDSFLTELGRTKSAIYLSIDKDVLSPHVVQTNWDQGVLDLPALLNAIDSTRARIVGADITGDVSQHRYRNLWKRMLVAIDHQPPIAPQAIASMQAQQNAVNRSLASALEHLSAPQPREPQRRS